MATTTNYSWTTPDDTALVKDGAAAIRSLGSSIDTTTKALNPETTLGDLAYRSSTANVKTRLALGTANQVLAVNSGATAPEWVTLSAGGMTLLSTTTLSGASTTISGISGSYNILYGVIYGVTNATGNGNFQIKPNDSASVTSRMSIGSREVWEPREAGDWLLNDTNATFQPNRTSTNNVWTFQIENYASATNYKGLYATGAYERGTGTNKAPFFSIGGLSTNSAITSLVFSNSGGNFSTGTVLLYGVK
jgi:hypothetical protein